MPTNDTDPNFLIHVTSGTPIKHDKGMIIPNCHIELRGTTQWVAHIIRSILRSNQAIHAQLVHLELQELFGHAQTVETDSTGEAINFVEDPGSGTIN